MARAHGARPTIGVLMQL